MGTYAGEAGRAHQLAQARRLFARLEHVHAAWREVLAHFAETRCGKPLAEAHIHRALADAPEVPRIDEAQVARQPQPVGYAGGDVHRIDALDVAGGLEGERAIVRAVVQEDGARRKEAQ